MFCIFIRVNWGAAVSGSSCRMFTRDEKLRGAGIVGKSGAAENPLIYKQKRSNWLKGTNQPGWKPARVR